MFKCRKQSWAKRLMCNSSLLLLASHTLHNISFLLLLTKVPSPSICNVSLMPLLPQYKCVALEILNIIFYILSTWKVNLHSLLQFCIYNVVLLILYCKTPSLIHSEIPTDLKLRWLCFEQKSTWQQKQMNFQRWVSRLLCFALNKLLLSYVRTTEKRNVCSSLSFHVSFLKAKGNICFESWEIQKQLFPCIQLIFKK